MRLHARGSTAPAAGEEDAPPSSSAESWFLSFCCWLGEKRADDLRGDETSVCKDNLPLRKSAFLTHKQLAKQVLTLISSRKSIELE